MRQTMLERLGAWWRAALADPRPATDSWEADWQAAIRGACQTLAESGGAIEAVDLRGERWMWTNGGQLLRLISLAQQIAAGFGLEAHVSYSADTPTIRLRSRP
jgi:hypothetical protein